MRAKQYWACTVDALLCAIGLYGEGRHNIVVHQGFAYGARKKLEKALRRAGRSFEIQPGNQNKRAEIRLADALCGYVAMMHDDNSQHALKKQSPP